MGALVLAQPDLMVPARDTWQHAGLACAILASPMGGWNGYVQLPPGTPRTIGRYSLPTPLELTYGPDPDGWVGFDTGHPWDVWAPDDDSPPYPPTWAQVPPAELPVLLPELARMRRRFQQLSAQLPGATTWTLPRLHALVDHFAERLATTPPDTRTCRGCGQPLTVDVDEAPICDDCWRS
jgi:hypothetical protein